MQTFVLFHGRSGLLEILKYLLSNAKCLNLDINDADANGENALFYASRSKHLDTCQYLLDHGKLHDVTL